MTLLRGGAGGGDFARAFGFVGVGGLERFRVAQWVRGGVQAFSADDVEEGRVFVGVEYSHHWVFHLPVVDALGNTTNRCTNNTSAVCN